MLRLKVQIAFIAIVFSASQLQAAEIYAAVASNFTGPMKALSSAFTAESGIHVKPVFASTGKLFAMIKNGGPFDIFLAADTKRPATLYEENFAQPPFVYAKGSVVLWSNIASICSSPNWQNALEISGKTQIVVANPKLAPYGASATKVINSLSIAGISDRLVFSQNVAQAFSLANKVTGLGFTAASMTKPLNGKQGCSWTVAEADQVEQSACIINSAPQLEATKKFAAFLISPSAKTLLSNYGYSD